MSRAYVLDSSAVLALIEEEDGADRVEEIVRGGGAILPFVVLLEVYYITRREKGEVEAKRRHALLQQLPAKVLWKVDEPLLFAAGRLKAERRLSLADALIAAYALQESAVLVHKDPEYKLLAGELELEAL